MVKKKAALAAFAVACAMMTSTSAFAATASPAAKLKKTSGGNAGFSVKVTSTAKAAGFTLQLSDDKNFKNPTELTFDAMKFGTSGEKKSTFVTKVGGKRTKVTEYEDKFAASSIQSLATQFGGKKELEIEKAPASGFGTDGEFTMGDKVAADDIVAMPANAATTEGEVRFVLADGRLNAPLYGVASWTSRNEGFVKEASARGSWTKKKSTVAIIGTYSSKRDGSVYARVRAYAKGAKKSGKWSKTVTLLKGNAATKKKTVALSVPSKATVSVGATKSLASGANGAKWKSSNAKVAKVSAKGVVTGVKAGKATITATAGKTTKKCVVTVKGKKAKKTSVAEAKKKAASLLKKAGYSKTEIAATIGAWEYESGMDPWAREGAPVNSKVLQAYADEIVNGTLSKTEFVADDVDFYGPHPRGFGIAQWTTTDRKAALWDYAKKRNSNVADLETQVKFAIKEMKAAGFGPGWAKKANLAKAVETFRGKYEGISDGATNAVVALAKKIYAKYA